jgi:hypothetical protein
VDGLIFLKFFDGEIATFESFLIWSHLSHRRSRSTCHYVDPIGQDLLQSYAQ